MSERSSGDHRHRSAINRRCARSARLGKIGHTHLGRAAPTLTYSSLPPSSTSIYTRMYEYIPRRRVYLGRAARSARALGATSVPYRRREFRRRARPTNYEAGALLRSAAKRRALPRARLGGAVPMRRRVSCEAGASHEAPRVLGGVLRTWRRASCEAGASSTVLAKKLRPS